MATFALLYCCQFVSSLTGTTVTIPAARAWNCVGHRGEGEGTERTK